MSKNENGVNQVFSASTERTLGYSGADVINKMTPSQISDHAEIVIQAKELSI